MIECDRDMKLEDRLGAFNLICMNLHCIDILSKLVSSAIISYHHHQESGYLGNFCVFSTISFRQLTIISFDVARGGLNSTTCHISDH